MQKKLLACLLVAPVAGTAMANIDIEAFPPEGAPSLTTTPGEGFDYNFNGGVGLAAPVGTGEVTFQKVELFPGNYKLTLGGVNNLVVNISGNGVTSVKGSDKEYTFEVGGNDKVEVAVSMYAKNASMGFGCTSATLEIVLDAETCSSISSALEKALGEVVPTALNKWNNDADLKSELQDINKKKEDIQGNINKIATNMSLVDYTTFQLWNGVDCTIAAEISKLASKVGTYNEKAATANKHAASEEYYNAVITNVVNKFGQNIKDLEAKIGDNEFLNGVVGEDLEKLQERLDEIKAEFDKARETDSCDRASDSPKNPWQSVNDTWNAIAGKYQAAVANQTAWTNYMSILGDFRQFYANDVLDAINAQKSVEGVTGDPFATKRGGYLKEVQVIFDANNSAYDGETLALGSPAATLNTAAEAIKAEGTVRGEITDKVNEFKTFVEQQNTAYTAATKEYKDLTDQFTTAVKDEKVPTSQAEDFATLKEAVKDALTALETYYTGAYGNTDVKAGETTPSMWPEYQTKVDAVKIALENLTKAIDSYAGINGLASKLDEVQAQIVKNGEELDKLAQGEFTFNLVEKLGATKAELDKAINELKPGQATTDIDKQIDEYEAAANEIFNALNGAIAKYNGFAADIKAYEEFIGKKTLIIGKADADAFRADDKNTQLSTLKEKLAGFAKAITDVTSLDNQACYDKAVILGGEEGYKTWTLDVAAAKGNFAQLATEANEEFAQSKVNEQEALVSKLAADKLLGIEKAPIDKLTGEMSAAKDAVATAVQDIDALAKCDTQLQDVVNHCATFQAQVEAYKIEIEKIADVPEQLEAAKEVNDTTMDPAKTYFGGENGVLAGYEADYNKLVENLGNALAGETIKINTNGTNDFTERANTLDNAARTVAETIKMNQANYDELLGKSQKVLEHVNSVITFITKNCQNDEKRKEYLDSLNTIKSTNLAGVDLDMTGDFGKGELNDAAKAGYITKYDEIIKAATGVQTDFDGEVSTLNEATAAGWKDDIAKVRASKDEAVKVYNAYYYDIKNQGYREFISTALQSHAHLFDYTQQITSLEGEIQKYINDKTAEQYVFSEAEFKENALDKIKAMETSIANDVNALVESMNKVGADYWTEQSDYRGGVYAALIQSMKAAGMFAAENTGDIPVLNATLLGKCPELQGAIDSYNNALTKHTAAEKATTEAAEPSILLIRARWALRWMQSQTSSTR